MSQRQGNCNVFLEGESVVLRPFEREDLPLVQSWGNDPEIRAIAGEVASMNRAQAEAYFGRIKDAPDRAWFVIALKEIGTLSFHRVSIGVVGFNERALRFYEKVGFKREGIQRDGYFHNHRFYDFVMMSILEDEYRDLYP